MPVPSLITDLSTTAASNSPAGGESARGTIDDYFRAHASFIAQTYARLPAGIICMWSGSTAAIPSGWFLCNGSNGTPNLQDRFVVAAGSGYAVGATGGSANATLVSHSHTVSASGTTAGAGTHSHSVNDPGHSHTNTTGTQILSNGTATFLSGYANNGTTDGAATGISINGVGDHTHTVSVSGGTSTDGSSATNANLPPYYALAYIMKA
jgi:hypothetical protein